MPPKTSSITTLLFDWDGTLVDSAQLGLTAFEQSFAALGVAFDHEVYRPGVFAELVFRLRSNGTAERKMAES